LVACRTKGDHRDVDRAADDAAVDVRSNHPHNPNAHRRSPTGHRRFVILVAVPARGGRAPARDARGAPARRGATRARPVRAVDEIRPGTPCVILLDLREGEPDRTGQTASFEGFFDFETGELRRAGTGIPRLRLGEERLWGFECWWRLDPQRGGLTDADRAELEDSKRLLRGLMRDARRSQRIPR
jgi:hypothetical protein